MKRAAVLWTALGCAGCAAPTTGEVMLAIDSDLALPRDLDTLSIQISKERAILLSTSFPDIGPASGTRLPATLGVIVSEDPSTPVTVRVVGQSHGVERVVNEVTTTIPEERVAMLRMPLQFLCGDVTCPPGQTCAAGACVPDSVDSSSLPDYNQDAIFGDGTCLDVGRCFHGATVAEVDTTTCTIADGGAVNVGLETESEGPCGPGGCYVALDAEDALGWRRTGGRVALPPTVCARLGETVVRVVTAAIDPECPQKTTSVPICDGEAPWPEVIAGAQDAPVALALAAQGDVLWVNQGSSAADGALKMVSYEGGPPATLAMNLRSPRGVAFDDGGLVLWAERGSGELDGAIREQAPSQSIDDVATQRPRPEAIVVAGKTRLWTEYGSGGSGHVVYLGPGMSEPAPVDAPAGSPFRIAAARDRACWSDHYLRQVLCVPLDADDVPYGTAEVIGLDEGGPQGVALETGEAGNAVAAYWVSLGAADDAGQIVKRAFNPDAQPKVLASAQSFPTGITIHVDHVYWTSRGSGEVWRTLKDGTGMPERVASGQRSPGAIIAGPDALFWVNEGERGARTGSIVRYVP